MEEIVYLDVKGMHCPDCPSKIERTVLKMHGVSQVKVNLETENGYVTFNNHLAKISDIINKISKMGFEAKTVQSNN